MTDLDNIVSFFKKFADETGLPVIPHEEWINFRDTYSRKLIKLGLAEYITSNKVPFPLKVNDIYYIKQMFFDLCKFDLDFIYPDRIDERYDFKYSYEKNPLGIIDVKANKYNVVSNHYQQENRMRCDSVYNVSPLECWNTKELLAKFRWIFWNDKFFSNGISGQTYRKAFTNTYYTCSQFKPSIAKLIYLKSNAQTVLDLSCGWGDRLAGFYATPNTKVYVGCDPNPAVYEVYKKQCLDYENFLGHNAVLIEKENHFICKGSKEVVIYNLPAENVDWKQYNNYFDLMFTSPPYFDLEKYSGDDQSWKKYPSYQLWKDDFLFPLCKKVIPTIKEKGLFMLNIVEPKTSNKKNVGLCDEMVDYVKSLDMFYIGKIGMGLNTRPGKLKEHSKNNVKTIEPIWCFRKGLDEPFNEKPNSIDDFF